MNSTKELFKNWMGTWVIKRVLGNYGIAEGSAKFTLRQPPPPSSSSPELVLLYREDVEVKYNNPEVSLGHAGQTPQTAYKEYLYIYDEAGDKIIKKFKEDDRLFYELKVDLEAGVAEGDHLCDRDLYKAKYAFKDKDHFSLSYCVKGPQKDYVILTEFIKISQEGS